jgi:hypothetical protein
MHPQRTRLLAINAIGGVAVLASYAYGLDHEATRAHLWGGVPPGLRPLYTASMLAAAAGYFAFSYFILFRLEPNRTRVGERLGFGVFQWIYAGILAPSALWMPLTARVIERPDPVLWLAIRTVLTVTGLSSLALVAALLTVQPRDAKLARRLAILGAAAFALQTAILDALVWPAYFRP